MTDNTSEPVAVTKAEYHYIDAFRVIRSAGKSDAAKAKAVAQFVADEIARLTHSPAAVEAIKTWEQRCEEHPAHEGIVTEGMIQQRMQEEIDDLRAAIRARPAVPDGVERMREALKQIRDMPDPTMFEAFNPLARCKRIAAAALKGADQ